MNKTLGYILIVAGAIITAASYPEIRGVIGLKSLGISDLFVMFAGVIVLIIGVFFAFRGSSAEQSKEVPIYEGEGRNRKVVGYRRMK